MYVARNNPPIDVIVPIFVSKVSLAIRSDHEKMSTNRNAAPKNAAIYKLPINSFPYFLSLKRPITYRKLKPHINYVSHHGGTIVHVHDLPDLCNVKTCADLHSYVLL